jgi:hypothetical protein
VAVVLLLWVKEEEEHSFYACRALSQYGSRGGGGFGDNEEEKKIEILPVSFERMTHLKYYPNIIVSRCRKGGFPHSSSSFLLSLSISLLSLVGFGRNFETRQAEKIDLH